jgi:hypothetical protein
MEIKILSKTSRRTVLCAQGSKVAKEIREEGTCSEYKIATVAARRRSSAEQEWPQKFPSDYNTEYNNLV